MRQAILALILFLTPALVLGAAGTVPGTSVKYEAEYGPTGKARTTGYYTAQCEKTGGSVEWCSPEAGHCLTSTDNITQEYPSQSDCVAEGKGWCCIPQEDRGFYEEVRCQGSGSCNGDVYHYSDIETTLGEGSLDTRFENGRTSEGTNPEKKKTIAVNPNPASDCYIPPGSKVYIRFGPDHPWNGQYVAEDTGSAFQGDGKADNGNCKIDVFAGVGPDAQQRANELLTRPAADAYIVEWAEEGEAPDISTDDQATSTIRQGFIQAQYQHDYDLPIMAALTAKATETQRRLRQCSTADDVKDCAEQALDKASTEQWRVTPSCGSKDTPIPEYLGDEDVIAEGTISDTSEITVSAGSASERTITVTDSNGNQVPIILRSQQLSKLDIQQGQRVRITDSFEAGTDVFTADTGEADFTLREVNLDTTGDLETFSTRQDSLVKPLAELASCKTGDDLCVCKAHNPAERQAWLADNTAHIKDTTDQRPYRFQLSDGSTIPTTFTPEMISSQGLNLTYIKQQARQAPDADNTSLSPSTTTYFLYEPRSDNLMALDKRPQWFQGEQSVDRYTDNLVGALQGIQRAAGIVENPASLLQDNPDTVPSCRPQTTYQSVCIEQRRGASYQPPMSLPPVKFVQPIHQNS